MVGGYAGKILRVNLTEQTISTEDINLKWAEDFIGGRGYGERLLFEEIDPTIDPLSEENKLIIATGPLGSTYAPSSGRVMVITKGALNGTIACSNSGGHFAGELKRAGYDMIVIEGKAEKPVYLWIYKGRAEIRDASKLLGKNTKETDKLLKRFTHPEASTLQIGPAAEKLSLISNITFDGRRMAGRTGIGAVMGSKNLKGVAVKGHISIKVADKERFAKAVFEARDILSKDAFSGKGGAKYGTAVLVNVINSAGGLPTRNAHDAYFEGTASISGERLTKEYLIKAEACDSCSIACGRITQISKGKYTGNKGVGPEYETIWALGAACGVDDLDAIVMANYLCNEYGLDTISAGATVACAMDLFEAGYIPKSDVGFELRFGDAEAMVEAIKSMCEQNTDFGKLLAKGSYRLAEHYGHPEFSMSVKKQEFPAYDPRAIKGIGLEYATSNRGACHVRGYTIGAEVLGGLDKSSYEGKAKLTKKLQDITAALDSAGICLFTTFGLKAKEIAELFASATGFECDKDEFVKKGERIWNLERIFNIKAGFSSNDDRLPERMEKEPIKTGPAKGETTDISKMLPEYYRLRGWDENGFPTQEKLKELGLEGLL
ncbi:aldehyde ferredoxin oxidoreductase family protein [Hippea maritima]|uniref:Aldehyde ferredoxin oxidoreductase n=1 Tax=Hippea maritima (strain ATCC 700847 / DSM 10411 / MH2) TaxID=760142 RepID=F2LVM0_HIPMA|nr:aldehyde ferredoxin oxidoreductase family protein [Hippea maritima]AEA33804.1 Aldehyde ferredoxin oxidoreductase [Hippea maritima DSM 10411]